MVWSVGEGGSGELEKSSSILAKQSVASNTGWSDFNALTSLSTPTLGFLWLSPCLKQSWWQPDFLLTENGLLNGTVAICLDAGGENPDSRSRGYMQQVQPCV